MKFQNNPEQIQEMFMDRYLGTDQKIDEEQPNPSAEPEEIELPLDQLEQIEFENVKMGMQTFNQDSSLFKSLQ